MSFQNQAQVVDLQTYRQAKNVVAANIKSFIKHGDPQRRNAMHTVVNAVMRNHGKTRMVFGSYEIILNDDFGITIRARRHSSKGDKCPTCGSAFQIENMTLVQVQEEGYCHDLVAWGCRKCGEVFARVEYTGGDMDV